MASQPTAPCKPVDLRALQVVVEDPRAGGDPSRSLTYITCHLYLFYDSATNAASLKLRFTLIPDNNLHIYLFIEPGQISFLSVDRSTKKNAELARLCGSSASGTICLRFTLQTPASVVGPNTWPRAGNTDALISDQLQFLAGQKAVAIHIPQSSISAANLQSMSDALSGRKLTTSAPHADLGRMYGGRGGGGRIVKDLHALLHGTTPVDLPPYDDVAGLSKSLGKKNTEPFRKRRREDSSPASDAEENVAHIAKNKEFREQMRGFIRDVMREDLAQEREAMRKDMMAELNKMEERLITQMNKNLDCLRDDIMERVEELEGIAVNASDLEEVVDDRTAGMKIEMEDWIKLEMHSVEDKMLDHFQNGTWSTTFCRPGEI
ncbi:hypothetical protein BD289DRAFT_158728 [Coniella lustricola]|uniref:Uncharacterized protein n=1 Tax=Coniella lustricola TaxID=2025994 RepID=A0A2T3AEI9_9PEZI|nr:hypothetical protein BD289DRAFT_158728 [Coniella lustricola]